MIKTCQLSADSHDVDEMNVGWASSYSNITRAIFGGHVVEAQEKQPSKKLFLKSKHDLLLAYYGNTEGRLLVGCLLAWLLGCLVVWLVEFGLLGVCLVAWLLGCLVAWLLGRESVFVAARVPGVGSRAAGRSRHGTGQGNHPKTLEVGDGIPGFATSRIQPKRGLQDFSGHPSLWGSTTMIRQVD